MNLAECMAVPGVIQRGQYMSMRSCFHFILLEKVVVLSTRNMHLPASFICAYNYLLELLHWRMAYVSLNTTVLLLNYCSCFWLASLITGSV